MMRRATPIRFRSHAFAFALLAGATAAHAAGPAATPPPAGAADSALATYDGGVVYPHDFNAAWWMLSPPERPPGTPLDSRKAFLVSVVDRQLLAEEAHKHAFNLTVAESLEMQHNRDQMLQNALFTEMTKDMKPPTDDDVARYRRQKNELAEIRFVFFADAVRARAWRSRFSMGTPFAELDAAIKREGPSFATADSFRFVAAEQIPDTLADIIWAMRPGQVSDIQEYSGHPALILVRSFSKRPAMATGENYAIKTELQSRQYAHLRERIRIDLATRLGRTFDEANMTFLLARHLKLPPRSDVDSVTGQPVIRPNLALPYITGADTARVLARIGKDSVTIAQYLHFWAHVEPYARPEVRERTTLDGAVDRIALEPALLAEANRRGLDSLPQMREAMANQREGYAVAHLYHDMFETKVKVTEAALRKYYAADPKHYDDRASVSTRIIVVDHKSLADSIRTQLDHGVSFTELVKQYSIDGQTAKNGGQTGPIYRGSQENSGLEEAMFKTPVGKLGGPIQTPSGWVVWKVEATAPGVKRNFADARWMVERDFKIVEADRLLTEYLAAEKAKRHVTYFNERITPTLGHGGPWD